MENMWHLTLDICYHLLFLKKGIKKAYLIMQKKQNLKNGEKIGYRVILSEKKEQLRFSEKYRQ